MTTTQGTWVASTLGKVLHGLVVATSESLLGEIECLSQDNLDSICDWNRRICVDPVDKCVHNVIAERTAELPDKEAVCAWDGTFTYTELDVVASQLAKTLMETGVVGKDTLIPLCFDKSVRSYS